MYGKEDSMDCHNHYRNNQDRNKDKKTKKKEQSFLTSPCHQELTPSPGSHPPVRFPACSLKRGDVEFEKNYCVDTTKHKTHGKRGVEDVISCTSHGQY
jgi:hypothetical protein